MPRDVASLASMQTALLSLITGRDGGAIAPDPESLIVSDARGSAHERLHVYEHMYRARMIEALETQFPRLAKHLGPDEFADLGAAYVSDEPSTHPSLRFIGRRLPDWLAARRPDARALGALARLEWARADVFDVVDEGALTMGSLRAWPQDRFAELPLRLIAAHRLVTADSGTADLWSAIGSGQVAAAAQAPDRAVGGSLLVWREGIAVYHRTLEESERSALELVAGGALFGVVCERLLASHGEEGAVAQSFAWLSTWVSDGLIAERSAAE